MNRQLHRRLWLALFVAPLSLAPAKGQLADDPPTVYLTVSMDARTRLNLVDAFLHQKEWAEAAELLQTLVEGQADKVVPISPRGADLYINLRTFCHCRIARLPAEGLRLYRNRVDGPANEILKQWRQTGDVALLQRLADEFFCSTPGDVAIEKLGDRALSLGRYIEAVAWWSRILPTEFTGGRQTPFVRIQAEAPGEARPAEKADDAELALLYPDPKTETPRVAAKWIVAKLLLGESAEAKRALEMLRRKYPDAAGTLAGSTGPYWKTVAELTNSSHFQPPAADADWLTFGGDSYRSKVVPHSIDVGGVQFLWDLEEDEAVRNADREGQEAGESRLPFHPVVVGDQAFLATDRHVWKFDLSTGAGTKWQELPAGRGNGESGRARQTLTIQGRKLYVCTHEHRSSGNERQRGFGARQFHNYASTLYCYDLRTQKELWKTTAAELTGVPGVVFEGAPVATGANVYIGLTRYDAMSETSVVCLDSETRRVNWQTVVCESTQENQNSSSQPLYNLLTLADTTIYYCTNLGAVAALSADNGRIRWASTYARRPLPSIALGEAGGPELNPCVYHQGLVFAAPRDGGRILCYDAVTGRKVWESPPALGVMHLLGVVKGRLIATGGRVYAFDVHNGKIAWRLPMNTVPGYGRGVLAGDLIYWPTRTEIHVYDPETGMPARPAIELLSRLGQKPGNLVIAGGYMLIAQSNRLLAICPYSKVIQKARNEVVARPKAAEPHFKLAQAAFQHGDWILASEHFQRAAELASPELVANARPLGKLAREQRFASLLALAKQAPAEQRVAEFAQALAAAPADKWRVAALSAECLQAQPARAAAICQTLLSSDSLRSIPIQSELGLETPASVWAGNQLQTLIAAHGRGLYADYDAEARRRLAEARGGPPEKLAELADRYPASDAVAEILLETADAHVAKGEYAAARPLLKKLARRQEATNSPLRARTLQSLVQCCRRSGRLEAADLVDALATREAIKQKRAPAARPQEPSSAAEPARPPRGAFHQRLVDCKTGLTEITLESAAGARSLAAHVAFLPKASTPGEGGSLSWRADERPDHVVSVELGKAPAWLGGCPVGLLVSTADEIRCYAVRTGQLLWSHRREGEPSQWTGLSVLAGSTAKEKTSPVGDFGAVGRLIAGDCLLSAESGRLAALDVDDGSALWEFTWQPSQDEVVPRLRLVGVTLCFQTEDRFDAFEPLTGRLLFTHRLGGGVEALEPVAVKGRIVAVTDRLTLTAFDERTGAVAWRRPVNSPAFSLPQLFANERSLVALLDDFQLLGVDPKDGKDLWRSMVAPRPSLDICFGMDPGGRWLVVLRPGFLECRSLADGAVAARRSTDVALPLESDEETGAETRCEIAALDRPDGSAGEKLRFRVTNRRLLAEARQGD